VVCKTSEKVNSIQEICGVKPRPTFVFFQIPLAREIIKPAGNPTYSELKIAILLKSFISSFSHPHVPCQDGLVGKDTRNSRHGGQRM
jgi:hypothetical protein